MSAFEIGDVYMVPKFQLEVSPRTWSSLSLHLLLTLVAVGQEEDVLREVVAHVLEVVNANVGLGQEAH